MLTNLCAMVICHTHRDSHENIYRFLWFPTGYFFLPNGNHVYPWNLILTLLMSTGNTRIPWFFPLFTMGFPQGQKNHGNQQVFCRAHGDIPWKYSSHGFPHGYHGIPTGYFCTPWRLVVYQWDPVLKLLISTGKPWNPMESHGLSHLLPCDSHRCGEKPVDFC